MTSRHLNPHAYALVFLLINLFHLIGNAQTISWTPVEDKELLPTFESFDRNPELLGQNERGVFYAYTERGRGHVLEHYDHDLNIKFSKRFDDTPILIWWNKEVYAFFYETKKYVVEYYLQQIDQEGEYTGDRVLITKFDDLNALSLPNFRLITSENEEYLAIYYFQGYHHNRYAPDLKTTILDKDLFKWSEKKIPNIKGSAETPVLSNDGNLIFFAKEEKKHQKQFIIKSYSKASDQVIEHKIPYEKPFLKVKIHLDQRMLKFFGTYYVGAEKIGLFNMFYDLNKKEMVSKTFQEIELKKMAAYMLQRNLDTGSPVTLWLDLVYTIKQPNGNYLLIMECGRSKRLLGSLILAMINPQGDFISIESLDRKQKYGSYNNWYTITTNEDSYIVFNKNIGQKNEVILATITPDGQVTQKRVDNFETGPVILSGYKFVYNPENQKVLFHAIHDNKFGIALLSIIGKVVKTYKT